MTIRMRQSLHSFPSAAVSAWCHDSGCAVAGFSSAAGAGHGQIQEDRGAEGAQWGDRCGELSPATRAMVQLRIPMWEYRPTMGG